MTRVRRSDGRQAEFVITLPSEQKLRVKTSENFVCVLQRFFASDIKPLPLDLKRLYRFARVEPLHKTAWLVGIIARREIRR